MTPHRPHYYERMMTLNKQTHSKENYLKIIGRLVAENDPTTIGNIAAELDVQEADARQVIDELHEMGLVFQVGDQVHLTASGNETAGKIVHNYEMVQEYLTRCLGVDESAATTVACALEHTLDYNMIEQALSGGVHSKNENTRMLLACEA